MKGKTSETQCDVTSRSARTDRRGKPKEKTSQSAATMMSQLLMCQGYHTVVVLSGIDLICISVKSR
jgi:hypothetical protein